MSSSVVYIVDDDAAVRDSLALLCETAGFPVECYDSAEAFLAGHHANRRGCVVLDVRLPRMSGLQLHEELIRRECRLPVIYLTAHGDIPMTVQAMKAGAADFLPKPVDGALLLDRIRAALALGSDDADSIAAPSGRRERLQRLTAREREIMLLVVAGHSNKVVAKRLGISFRTVEIHRSRILRKTGAANLLELVRLAADCGLTNNMSGRGRPA